jgi:sugar-specific transcriptional regulator TrmB
LLSTSVPKSIFTAKEQRLIGSEESYLSQLAKLGLSSLETRVYVALLKTGASGARAIANIANIDRVETYRTLKSLAKKGLVEIAIGKPSIYNAALPDLVIKTLLAEKERQLSSLKTSMNTVQSWLESIRNKESTLIADIADGDYFANFSVKLAKQTLRYYNSLLSNVKKEILLVWSGFGLHIHAQEGTIDLFRRCHDRGLRILGITEENGRYSSEIRRWSKFINLRYIRSMEGRLRYMIVDSAELTLALNEIPCDINSFALLSTKNRTMVRGFEMDFYTLWNSANI